MDKCIPVIIFSPALPERLDFLEMPKIIGCLTFYYDIFYNAQWKKADKRRVKFLKLIFFCLKINGII